MIISYPASLCRIIYCFITKTLRHIIENLNKKVKDRNAAIEKKRNHLSITCDKRKGRRNLSMCCNVSGPQIWMNWMKLADWGERRLGLHFLKKCAIYQPWTVLNGQWSRKDYFNHCFTWWNRIHTLRIDWIDAQAKESKSQILVPFAFLIKMKTFSVYFEELEHYFTENGQK